MARLTPSSPDLARSVVVAAFVANGFGNATGFFPGGVNLLVWGTFVGTVKIQRSFDGGTNWFYVETDLAGADLAITAPASIVLDESESGVLYRAECQGYTSGIINVRLSQG